MNKQIGERIKDLRQRSDLTQAELAAKVGFTPQTVSNWESGSREPDIDALIKLSTLFQVSLDFLLSGKKEENITMDDMDAEKRLSWLISKDDSENFKKYEYQTSAYVFGRSTNYRYEDKLREPVKKTWEEIISKNAKKIFCVCCDEIIKMNAQKIWAAFLVYDFIDEFVKMAIDCDRPDILETIGFRIFAVGVRPKNRVGEIPFMHPRETGHYVSSVDTYFIKEETFEYLFQNREKSPKCYEYATTLELQIQPLDPYKKNKEYTFTHLEDSIVRLAIKYGYFDTLDKILSAYKAELKNENIIKSNYDPYNGSYNYSWQNTYILYHNRVVGRIFYFQEDAINQLLKAGKTEYAKKLNDYNAEAIKRLKELNYGVGDHFDKIPYLSENDFNRAVKLNGNLSESERTYLLCINEKILVPNAIGQLRDLKLVREILNKGYYDYYEFAFDSLTSGKPRELYRFFIDHGLDALASDVIVKRGKYGELLGSIWTTFNLKPGNTARQSYSDVKKLIEKQNQVPVGQYGSFKFENASYDASVEATKLDENKLIAYIKSLKEEIYANVAKQIEKENKAKQDAIDRAKAVKGLTKEYFEGLLSKKGLFAKKEQRLFILDLCSLLDAILKFDYGCEGEDLFERMDDYFEKLSDGIPQSRTMDDGWGYDVLDENYEENVVKPAKKQVDRIKSLLSRLRIQRNNIAHSESKKVEELSEEELKECLDYVFSINKEVK